MSGYVINKSATPILRINGIDYSSQLITWNVSDDSAYKNGLLTTRGTLSLASLGNTTGLQVEDYNKNDFRRGSEVSLDLIQRSGATSVTRRHPRGLLYILGTSYSIENNQLEISLGCKISLYLLNDEQNLDKVIGYAALPLDEDQKTIQNVGATLAATGQFLYQDKAGDLQKAAYFQSTGSPWISVLGVTAISASPLKGADSVPDQVKVSYERKADEESDFAEEPTITTSTYSITYPAVVYERVPIVDVPLEEVPPPDEDPQDPVPTLGEDACGNTPRPPEPGPELPDLEDFEIGETNDLCSQDAYTTTQTVVLKTVKKREKSYTLYRAIGGQVSYRYQEVVGPALEVNRQYFADSYAYCAGTYATRCRPNGNCPYDGLKEILQSYSETTYEYDPEDGALLRETTDVYETTLSAAQPADWRSAVVNGVPQDFTTLSLTTMYRSSSRIVEYSREGNVNITKETIWESNIAENGISGSAGGTNVWESTNQSSSAAY